MGGVAGLDLGGLWTYIQGMTKNQPKPSIAALWALSAKADLTAEELSQVQRALNPLVQIASAALSFRNATTAVAQQGAAQAVIDGAGMVRE